MLLIVFLRLPLFLFFLNIFLCFFLIINKNIFNNCSSSFFLIILLLTDRRKILLALSSSFLMIGSFWDNFWNIFWYSSCHTPKFAHTSSLIPKSKQDTK